VFIFGVLPHLLFSSEFSFFPNLLRDFPWVFRIFRLRFVVCVALQAVYITLVNSAIDSSMSFADLRGTLSRSFPSIWVVNAVYLSIYLTVYLSIAPHSLVGTWPLVFSFLILYTVGRTPWTGDQPVARPLATHRINAHRHPCLEWNSNPWSQCSSERRQFIP
jgi:hypothetical protein